MYLIDANVLIEAKNRYYAFDIAPGFWKWLDIAHRRAFACSIEAVRDELLKGNDELAAWAHDNPRFFRPIDQGTTSHFPFVSRWATSQQYTRAALDAFTGNHADFQLVAYAREHQHVIVTHEEPRPQARKRVLIPDACHAAGVSTTDTFRMLRQTGAVLDLRERSAA